MLRLPIRNDQFRRLLADKNDRLIVCAFFRRHCCLYVCPVVICRQVIEIPGQRVVPLPLAVQLVTFQPAFVMTQIPVIFPVLKEIPVRIDRVRDLRFRNWREYGLTVQIDEYGGQARIKNRRGLVRKPCFRRQYCVGREIAQHDVERYKLCFRLNRLTHQAVEHIPPRFVRYREARYRNRRVLDRNNAQFKIGVSVRREFGHTVNRLILSGRRYFECNARLNRLVLVPCINLGNMNDNGSCIAVDSSRKGKRSNFSSWLFLRDCRASE